MPNSLSTITADQLRLNKIKDASAENSARVAKNAAIQAASFSKTAQDASSISVTARDNAEISAAAAAASVAGFSTQLAEANSVAQSAVAAAATASAQVASINNNVSLAQSSAATAVAAANSSTANLNTTTNQAAAATAAAATSTTNLTAAQAAANTATQQATIATTQASNSGASAAASAGSSTTANAQAIIATTQANNAAISAAAAALQAGIAQTQAAYAGSNALVISNWINANAPAESLTSLIMSAHYGPITASYLYDTSKDTDGSQWRKRCAEKSWYTEALGGTTWLGQSANETTIRASSKITTGPVNLLTQSQTYSHADWVKTTTGTSSAPVLGSLQIAPDGTTTAQRITFNCTGTTIGDQSIIDHSSMNIISGQVHTQAIWVKGTPGQIIAFRSVAGVAYGTLTFDGTWQLFVRNETSTITTGSFSFGLRGTIGSTTGSVTVDVWTSGLFQGTYSAAQILANGGIPVTSTVPAAYVPATYTSGALQAIFQNTTDGKFYRLNPLAGTTEVIRGISAEFPVQALLVAEAGRLIIYDASAVGCPMWMVFNGNIINSALGFDQTTGSTGTNSAVAAINGIIYLTQNVSNNGCGLRKIDFITDIVDRISDSLRLGTWRFNGGIGRRQSALGGYLYSTLSIANLYANCVAVGVLSSAATDQNTGLPKPTVAIGTDGGITILKDDDTVVNSADTNKVESVSIKADYLYVSRQYGVDAHSRFVNLSGISNSFVLTSIPIYVGNPSNISAGADITTVAATNSGLVAATSFSGAAYFKPNLSAPNKSLLANITKDFNTGLQLGDYRRTYLSDIIAETINSTPLITGDNSTFTGGLGSWINSTTFPSTAAVTSGEMIITPSGNFGSQLLAIPTIIGKTYLVTAAIRRVSGTAGSVYISLAGTSSGASDAKVINSTTSSTAVTISGQFTAFSTTSYLACRVSNAADIGGFDNITCQAIETDRSIKNKPLNIIGTLNKAPVATGANLVAYSGFSSSNYLQAPYSNEVDFAGDFTVYGWARSDGVVASTQSLFSLYGTNNRGIRIGRATSGGVTYPLTPYVSLNGSNNSWGTFGSTAGMTPLTLGTWNLITVSRYGNEIDVYVNDKLNISVTANLGDLSTLDGMLTLGTGFDLTTHEMSQALWRVSGTAITAAQVASIYNAEKQMFQPGALCNLDGNSNFSRSISYDTDTDTWHLATDWGRSSFRNLVRVGSEATVVGSISTLTSGQGTIFTGGSTQGNINQPAFNLRDEIRRHAKTSGGISSNQNITLSGDATGNGTTAITVALANSGVTAGTYNNSATSVTPYVVDAKGRITGTGTPVTITPAWSNVSGKPTTIAGLGVTDNLVYAGANSNITSLTGLTTALSTTQGGTGVSSTPTNGQILIGNGTGYTLASLTAGANITITPSAGGITIASTGGGGGTATYTKQEVIPSAGQTVFTVSGGYTPGILDVILNGVTMGSADITATNGTTVTFATPRKISDVVTFRIWSSITTLPTTGTGNIVLATSPTIVSPIISQIVNTGTLSLPTSTDTLVGRTTTDTLTNKTLTAPVINGFSGTGNASIIGTLSGLTGLTIASGGYTVTGNSTLTGTLSGLTGITVASGGINVTGNSVIAGTLSGISSLSVNGAGTFGTAITVGSGTGIVNIIANGINSGASGGASIIAQNSGSSIIAIGNYSALVGGTYDTTSTLWANGIFKLFNGATNLTLDTSGNLNTTGTIYGTEVTLTDAATISWDSTKNVAKVTIAGNRTMAAPTNLKPGAFYALNINQDATGGRTIAWNAVFKFIGGTAPTLSIGANAKDFIVFRSDGTNLYEQGRALGDA